MEGILLNQNKSIDKEIIDEMKEINLQNHFIAIVTSRSYKESMKHLKEVKHLINFFVGNNGAILVDNIKQNLLKTPKTIGFKFINSILKDVELLGGAVQIITSKKIYIDSYINSLKNNSLLQKSIIPPNTIPTAKYEVESVNMYHNKVIQLTIVINCDLIQELLIYFKKFYTSDYNFNMSSNITIDINVAGVNRYEGIKTIMSFYKLDNKNVFCFGYTQSDLELMQNIKNTYALENATPIIQNLAKNIINVGDTKTISFEIQKILKDNL